MYFEIVKPLLTSYIGMVCFDFFLFFVFCFLFLFFVFLNQTKQRHYMLHITMYVIHCP